MVYNHYAIADDLDPKMKPTMNFTEFFKLVHDSGLAPKKKKTGQTTNMCTI